MTKEKSNSQPWAVVAVFLIAAVILAVALLSTKAQAGTAQCRTAEQTGQWILIWSDPSGQYADVCAIQIGPGGAIQSNLSECFNTPGARVTGNMRATPRCSITLNVKLQGQGFTGEFIMNRTRDTLTGFLFDQYQNFMGPGFAVKQ